MLKKMISFEVRPLYKKSRELRLFGVKFGYKIVIRQPNGKIIMGGVSDKDRSIFDQSGNILYKYSPVHDADGFLKKYDFFDANGNAISDMVFMSDKNLSRLVIVKTNFAY